MSRETSKDVAAIAAKLMEHPDPDVRRVAASCLAQREVTDIAERAWGFYRPFFDRITDWGQSEAGRSALGIKLGASIMDAVCEHLEALPELQAEHERIVARLREALRFYADEGHWLSGVNLPASVAGETGRRAREALRGDA